MEWVYFDYQREGELHLIEDEERLVRAGRALPPSPGLSKKQSYAINLGANRHTVPFTIG